MTELVSPPCGHLAVEAHQRLVTSTAAIFVSLGRDDLNGDIPALWRPGWFYGLRPPTEEHGELGACSRFRRIFLKYRRLLVGAARHMEAY